MIDAIRLETVSKTFNLGESRVRALDQVSFRIEAGEKGRSPAPRAAANRR